MFFRVSRIVTMIALLAATACADEPARSIFPLPESQGGWETLTTPAQLQNSAGIAPAKIDALRAWLLASDDRDFAAVVVCGGRIVLEVERGNSSRTDARRVASVSKAVCATVLAIASEESRSGRLPKRMSFEDNAFDYLPWAQPLSDPRKAQITVAQLLNHTSGICPEATGMKNAVPWDVVLGRTEEPLTKQLAFDPGAQCGYSTHAFHHAALVCETVTGMPYDQYAVQALFKPIGCEHWTFEVLPGSESIGSHPSHGLGMPARDLARIAYCMLRGGKWKERQVIPKWFVDQTAAATHSVTSPELRFKLPAESFTHGWELPALRQSPDHRTIPSDARFKPGSGGQLIAFVPSLDLVITRQTGSSGQWDYVEFVAQACQAVQRPASP